MTKILSCTCTHPDQDQLYGFKRRVHNSTAQTPTTYRCTVCGTVRSEGDKPKTD